MKKHFLNEPDTYQREAINHDAGSCLVLAGPGCGKTFVITHHINFLINYLKVNPSKILVITFTKMAAKEMEERFLKLIHEKNCDVIFGTCHSVFYKILKSLTPTLTYEIISEKEDIRRRNNYIRENYYPNIRKENTKNINAEIKDNKINDIEINEWFENECEEMQKKVLKAYSNQKKHTGKITYDDILLFTYEYLISDAKMLKYWQDRFRHILIDEFQDTNQIQYNIIKLLCSKETTVFAVGDDDQSIYAFRGATPGIVNTFLKDYKPVNIIKLKYNYRSDNVIVKHAMHLISNNNERVDKNLFSVKNGVGVIKHLVFDKYQEMYDIIPLIIHEELKNTQPEKICILVRTNIKLMHIAQILIKNNIPFVRHESDKSIMGHFVVNDILAYLYLGKVRYERKYMYMVMNKPNRYIARNSIRDEIFSFEEVASFYNNNPPILHNIHKLQHLFTTISTMEPYAAIMYIRKHGGYDEYLNTLCTMKEDNKEICVEILDIITDFSKKYHDYNDFINGLADFSKNTKERDDQGKINIMSFHASKGLEYDTVIIPELVEGIVPHKKSENIEEERRLMYVAITRAKHNLYLLSYNTNGKKKYNCSRFIDELMLQDYKSSKSKSSRYSS